MGFSRQEYWSGLPFPSPGDLPNLGIEPVSPTLQADTLLSESPEKPLNILRYNIRKYYHQTIVVKEVWLEKIADHPQMFQFTLSPCCGSVAKSCLTLCDPMDCSSPGFLVLHFQSLLKLMSIESAIQPSHPLISLFSSCLQYFPASGSLVSSSYQMAKVLELQLQHQFF